MILRRFWEHDLAWSFRRSPVTVVAAVLTLICVGGALLALDTSAYMLGWGVATFDGLYTLQSLVRTKTTGADGSFNQGRISDAKLDAIIDAIKVTTDTKKRDAILKEALEITRDQAYYVPLHHQMRPWAMKKGVSIVYSLDDRPQARFATVK